MVSHVAHGGLFVVRSALNVFGMNGAIGSLSTKSESILLWNSNELLEDMRYEITKKYLKKQF